MTLSILCAFFGLFCSFKNKFLLNKTVIIVHSIGLISLLIFTIIFLSDHQSHFNDLLFGSWLYLVLNIIGLVLAIKVFSDHRPFPPSLRFGGHGDGDGTNGSGVHQNKGH